MPRFLLYENIFSPGYFGNNPIIEAVTDHIGGWVSNRTGPLKVWGPGGLKPKFGTKYAVDRLREMFTWDLTGRRGNMPSAGGNIEVTEFDYSKSNVVYKKTTADFQHAIRVENALSPAVSCWKN